jgi:hypothetical protein
MFCLTKTYSDSERSEHEALNIKCINKENLLVLTLFLSPVLYLFIANAECLCCVLCPDLYMWLQTMLTFYGIPSPCETLNNCNFISRENGPKEVYISYLSFPARVSILLALLFIQDGKYWRDGKVLIC